MKKFIFIINAVELLEKLLMGKRVEGVLFIDKGTGRLTFKAYQRKSPKRPHCRLIRQLEHGWVKESKERIRVFESIPKELGTTRVMSIIDTATNTCTNARLGLESAIQQYQCAENKFDNAVTTISGKVDTINEHIDQVMEDAPTKLKVSVTLCDADWENIQEMFSKQREWVISQAQATVQTVNTMLVEERKKTMNRYKEYDGCYLGHYAQWFFWFFFTIGFSVVAGGIAMLIAQNFGK